MNNYLVFREEGLTLKQSYHRYEHNERKAKKYNNDNIYEELSEYNIYYKKIDDDKTYEDIFNEKLKNKEISTRGLKKDAKMLSEIILAVNAKYWKNKKQEDILKTFDVLYDSLKQRFGEENIISCVLHTDEIYTDQNGDEYVNYHMHCILIPINEKKIYYTKRSKDKAGELKEIIKQVSHSNCFASKKNEKHELVYSYSIIQDEIIDNLKKNGIYEIERGNANSMNYHMSIPFLKQVMNDLENQNVELIDKIKIKEHDKDTFLIKRDSIEELEKVRKNVCKEKSCIDEITKSIESTNEYIREQKNVMYNNAEKLKKYDIMKAENDRLKRENAKLSDEISIMNYIISLIINLIRTIIEILKDDDRKKEEKYYSIQKYIYNINDILNKENDDINIER